MVVEGIAGTNALARQKNSKVRLSAHLCQQLLVFRTNLFSRQGKQNRETRGAMHFARTPHKEVTALHTC